MESANPNLLRKLTIRAFERNKKRSKILIQDSVVLFKQLDSIIASKYYPDYPETEPLLIIEKLSSNQTLFLRSAEIGEKPTSGYTISTESGEMWTFVGCNKMKDPLNSCRLEKGNKIMIGQVVFEVKDLIGLNEDIKTRIYKKQIFNPDILCRVCLCEENESDDPLISPCNCSGTVKYVHLKCFKLWIDSISEKKLKENSFSFSVKNPICEISKCQLQLEKIIGEHHVNFFSNLNLKQPYMVLESSASAANEYSIFLISFYNNHSLQIGRKTDNDIIVCNSTVSKYHAELRYENGQIIIKDKKSSYGTLITKSFIEMNESTTEAFVRIKEVFFRFNF